MKFNSSNRTMKGALLTGASAAAIVLTTSATLAQEASDNVDEVVVKGIRGSLERSVDIKRNAKGIVDSISAEDMGKFPDSNLAESLQRVTGVSIDRSTLSGEGQYVTVRGFGADYNLVTLNGRTMPTSTLGNFASAPSTRSFDFGNLAPEAVSRVDIYKTAKAKTASGGVGSTIDIRTSRPLDAPGFSATVGVKSVQDDSDPENGNEVSFLAMGTFLDDRVGVAVTAIQNSTHHTVGSFRHSWASGFEAMGSNIKVQANDEVGLYNGDTLTNAPADGVLIANLHDGAGYYVDEIDQDRNNYQITFQAQLMDNLTATLDYTSAELEHEVNESRLTVWSSDASWQQYGMDTVWGPGNPATPISMTYNHAAWNTWGRDGNPADLDNGRGTDDLDSAMMYQNNITEMESVGLNLEWDASERLVLAFDYHDSQSESLPLSPYGSSASIGAIRSLANNWTVNYDQEIPNIVMRFDDQVLADVIQPTQSFFTGATNINSRNMAEIEQLQVNGVFDAAGSDFEDYVDTLEFGVSLHTNTVESAFGEIAAGNWGGLAPQWGTAEVGSRHDTAIWASGLTDLRQYFDRLGGSNLIFPQFVRSTYDRYFEAYSGFQRDNPGDAGILICGTADIADCKADYTTFDTFEEETTSFYVQANKDFDLMDKPASVVVGLRYEETDVTSSSLVPIYGQPTWVDGADDINAPPSGNNVASSGQGSYDVLLPSIDFDIDYSDELKLRAAVSKTITRQGYGNLRGGVAINPLLSAQKGTQGETGNSSSGNPALEPFETINYDVSAEYYYGDRSYASLGYFQKTVSNYVGSGISYINVQGIRNPAYLADGTPVTNPGPGSSILADDTNELVLFRNALPAVSDREEDVSGLELAIQHDFSDRTLFGLDLSGFGIIANMTLVDTDAEYDDTVPNSQADSQFAIIGISDSANLIGYYEQGDFSGRVAWNWRDRFLNYSGTSSGYTEEYESIDVNLSYSFPEAGITITYDGINLGEEGRRTFERNNPAYVTWVSQGHAKHYIGLRWKM
ncbi:MAG: TonB-dependent receptor [Parvibaculales bacterium]